MDLMDLTPKSDEIVITLLHPNTEEIIKNDDGSDMSITVYASHTKEYKKAMHEQANKRLKKAQKTKDQSFTSEDLEQASLDILSKVTKDWNITFKGEKPKMTLAKAREVFESVFWIKDQVEVGLAEPLDFMKG